MSSGTYWEKLSNTIQSPEETYNKRSDIADIVSRADASFILRYTNPASRVLDLGSGSGMVVNKIYEHIAELVAVETYPGFNKFIADADNVLVINAGLESFRIRRTFDLVTVTGVMQFFPMESARRIYRNIYEMLVPGGRLIARNHVGLHQTFTVEKSDELQSDYFAEFREINSEEAILKECGFSVEIFDEVPSAYSHWDNTRHMYFVCLK